MYANKIARYLKALHQLVDPFLTTEAIERVKNLQKGHTIHGDDKKRTSDRKDGQNESR